MADLVHTGLKINAGTHFIENTMIKFPQGDNRLVKSSAALFQFLKLLAYNFECLNLPARLLALCFLANAPAHDPRPTRPGPPP